MLVSTGLLVRSAMAAGLVADAPTGTLRTGWLARERERARSTGNGLTYLARGTRRPLLPNSGRGPFGCLCRIWHTHSWFSSPGRALARSATSLSRLLKEARSADYERLKPVSASRAAAHR